jgi:large repetitive protein
MRNRNWFGGIAILTLASALASGQESGLVIDTTSLPEATLNAPYSPQTLSASSQYSTESYPITWSCIGGQLPTGITLSSDGVLSGTPSVPGLASFTVEASQTVDTEGGPFTFTATQDLSLFVFTPLSITTNSLPAGTVGLAYLQTFAAQGIPAGSTESWAVITGTLPPGLSLSLNGVLSGIPTTSGSYPFAIHLVCQSSSGEITTATHSYTLIITAASPLTITTNPSLTPASPGVAYNQQMTATGGVPPYVWSVASGALPDGIGLNATTGLLSGTPTSAGTFSFQLSVGDQHGTKATGTFSIVVAAPLTISTAPTLPAGVSGLPYSTTLAATGGTVPYTWSVLPQAGPTPPGLALNPSTGALTGTPTASGSYQFLAGVADAAGHTASKLLSVDIAAALTITTASPLPEGAVGSAYQLQFTATGGTPAYAWSIASGALPAGLALDPASGMLSGNPSAGGTFDVTIGVKDAVQSVTKAYSLKIGVPALPTVTITGLPDSPPPATQPALGIGLSAPYSLDVAGHATLTFAPDSAADDPAVQFTTGGRIADFQIPAGSTEAVFGSPSLGVQTGTVAGTITITLQTFAAGVDVTPTPAPTRVIRIAGTPPVITSTKLVATSSGFDLEVIGYATTREVTGATVHLTPASGAQLASSDFTIALTSVFAAWYQDPSSAQYGSQFSLRIPFQVQNAANAIGSLSVTLANSQGVSAAANATF